MFRLTATDSKSIFLILPQTLKVNCEIQHWVKTLLQRGISEPIFYGDLVYKFKRIVGKPYFSDQFKKIVKRYIRVGYNFKVGYYATVCMPSFKPNHGL